MISLHMVISKPPEKLFGNPLKFGNYRRRIFCIRIGSGAIHMAINIIILTLKKQINQVDIKWKCPSTEPCGTPPYVTNFKFISVTIIYPNSFRSVS